MKKYLVIFITLFFLLSGGSAFAFSIQVTPDIENPLGWWDGLDCTDQPLIYAMRTYYGEYPSRDTQRQTTTNDVVCELTYGEGAHQSNLTYGNNLQYDTSGSFWVEMALDPEEWAGENFWYWTGSIISQDNYSADQYQNSIIPNTPADESVVPAYTLFSGVYSNDGEFNTIGIFLANNTIGGPYNITICDTAEIGSGLTYACYRSNSILTSYSYQAFMWDSSQTFPDGTLIADIIDFTTSDIYSIPPDFGGIDCSTFDVGCYMQQALQYLFMPSQDALNDFFDLYDLVKNKPPFGYVFAVYDTISNVDIGENEAFELQSMPVLNEFIFFPIRTALIWIFWIAFLFVFYHRLKNIHL